MIKGSVIPIKDVNKEEEKIQVESAEEVVKAKSPGVNLPQIVTKSLTAMQRFGINFSIRLRRRYTKIQSGVM